jgi:16S rRNA (cytosine1402-N4)-methyltransferase
MTIVDCNLGHAGHGLDILRQLRGEGLYIGIDIDPLAVETAERRLQAARIAPTLYKLIVGNHANLSYLLKLAQVPPSGGVLLDLGPSTPQLLQSRLGMSWDSDQPLDMRLDPKSEAPSAGELLNDWDEEDLTRMFRENAEEKWSRRIARRIVERREPGLIWTGRELGRLVGEAIPRKAWPPKTHPATRVFLALRIEVNQEFANLEAVLPQALDALAPGGRLVTISFSGGEDKRVKAFFQAMSRPVSSAPWPLPQRGSEIAPRLKVLTPQPVWASEEEIASNRRSRSARLRAAQKIE